MIWVHETNQVVFILINNLYDLWIGDFIVTISCLSSITVLYSLGNLIFCHLVPKLREYDVSTIMTPSIKRV